MPELQIPEHQRHSLTEKECYVLGQIIERNGVDQVLVVVKPELLRLLEVKDKRIVELTEALKEAERGNSKLEAFPDAFSTQLEVLQELVQILRGELQPPVQSASKMLKVTSG